MSEIDQEQTERGASTGKWMPESAVDALLAGMEAYVLEIRQLRADLERATAELAEAEAKIVVYEAADYESLAINAEAVQLKAERDAMREVCEMARFLVNCGMAEEGSAYARLEQSLARLDATRKATADATEEGK